MQWLVIVPASLLLALVLMAAKLPAALLMGPMIIGIIAGVNGASVRVPVVPYGLAQAVVGCLVASVITPSIMVSVLKEFPLFLGIILITLAASSLLGWAMSRWSVLPGTTAVWGSSPGAATAMMLMAEAFGADPQLVAFMQYLRVVFVAIAASLISRIWTDATGAAPPPVIWFPPVQPVPLVETIALAVGGMLVAQRFRIPAGTFLVPMVVGAVLHATGLMTIELPEWLLAASYALLGWRIGLGFTREILRHASRALPQIVLSIVALIGFCAAIAFGLTRLLGIDPLTAYLATSPGGMDSVAIIATSSGADLSFVMALQTMRLIIVMIAGPPIARLVARSTAKRQGG